MLYVNEGLWKCSSVVSSIVKDIKRYCSRTDTHSKVWLKKYICFSLGCFLFRKKRHVSQRRRNEVYWEDGVTALYQSPALVCRQQGRHGKPWEDGRKYCQFSSSCIQSKLCENDGGEYDMLIDVLASWDVNRYVDDRLEPDNHLETQRSYSIRWQYWISVSPGCLGSDLSMICLEEYTVYLKFHRQVRGILQLLNEITPKTTKTITTNWTTRKPWEATG